MIERGLRDMRPEYRLQEPMGKIVGADLFACKLLVVMFEVVLLKRTTTTPHGGILQRFYY
jgi:hypothetical protein